MSTYIPTTEDVRRAYREHCRDYDAIDGLATSPESYEEEFDRWFAQVRAETLRDLARVLQEALPESPSAAQTDRMKFAIGFLNASAENPYRKEDQ